MAMVMDASVVMAWHFGEENQGAARSLMDRALAGGVVVPAHWFGEVANAALMGERRQRAGLDQTSQLIDLISRLSIEVDGEGAEHSFDRILPLARAHRLTIYDAYYLELASRLGLPLASFDGDLVAAARTAGMEIAE